VLTGKVFTATAVVGLTLLPGLERAIVL
jgi:hypothetical protein